MVNSFIKTITVYLVSFFMLVPTFARNGESRRRNTQDVQDMGFWEQMSGGTSTVNSFKKLCGKDENFLETFNMDNYTQMCEVLLEHELCRDIPRDERVDCRDPDQNETNYLTPWMLWNCVSAFFSLLKDLLNFIVDAVKWVGGMITDSDFREENFAEANEFYDSIMNYLAVEFEKEKEKGHSNTRAAWNLAGTVLSKVTDSLADLVGTTYSKLGCYNPQTRRKKMCRLALEIMVPPAMALSLVFWKGPKMMAWLRKTMGKDEVVKPKKPRAPKTTEEKNFATLIQVYEDNKGLLKDHEKETTYFYPGRTIRAFEATPAEDVAKIFDPKRGGMSRDDFEEMYWSMKAGDIKATPQQMSFVDDIRHMIDDHGPFFWKEAASDKERGFAIIETLRRADAEWSMAKGRNASALATEKALSLTEKGVIDRALGEHLGTKFADQKWYHNVRNYFFPHYKRVNRIIEANNTVRRRLQLAYKADEPFDHSLTNIDKSDAFKLQENDRVRFREKIGDTAAELRLIREDIKGIYDQDLTITNPQRPQHISVTSLDRSIRNRNRNDDGDLNESFTDLYDRSNADLDELEDIMDRRFVGEPDRGHVPTVHYHDTHLKIRHGRHKQRTKQTRGTYQRDIYSKRPRNPDYEVNTEWTVTVYHEKTEMVWKTRRYQDSEGNWKTERYQEAETKRWTTSYTRDRREDIPARVGEVLDNEVTPRTSDLAPLPYAQPRGMHAVSATNGSPRITWVNQNDVNRIMASGREARAIEQPFRNRQNATEAAINKIQERYQGSILNNPQGKEAALKELDELIDNHIRLASEVNNHRASASSKVTQIWKDDNLTDFKVRNDNLQRRVDNMVDRLRFTREQILRDHPTLDVNYRLPDHSRDLARLKEIHDRYRKQQMIAGGTAATAGAAAVGETWYASENPEYDSKTVQMIEAVDNFFTYQDQPWPED